MRVERVTVAPIGEHELALVVGAPEIVRLRGRRQSRPGRLVTLGSATAAHQSMPIERGVHGADRGRLDPEVRRLNFSRIFGAPQLGCSFFRLHDPRLDLEGQAVGLPIRRRRPIGEPVQAAILVASEDLVAGLREISNSRHSTAIFSPSSNRATNRSRSSILLTLPPRHLRLPQRPESVTYVPGMNCYPLCQEGQFFETQRVSGITRGLSAAARGGNRPTIGLIWTPPVLAGVFFVMASRCGCSLISGLRLQSLALRGPDEIR